MATQRNRRDFLKEGVITGAGLVLGCSCLCGCSNLQKSKGKEGKTMEKMIAYCGLRCDTCAILLATRETDREKKDKMKAEIVQQCKKSYGVEYKLEDITDCDGCKTEDGRLFSSRSKCQIRKCAREKGVENCAYCSEYVCEKLEKLFSTETEGKATLDEIRKSL